MPSLVQNNESIPRERLLTVIALIMILEHKELGLDELMKATGMTFPEAISSKQNLVNTRLISVIPSNKKVPSFALIDEDEGYKFLELAGINPNHNLNSLRS